MCSFTNVRFVFKLLNVGWAYLPDNTNVLNQTFQSCTVKMILPRKEALCLGFNLLEVSENNQTMCSFTNKEIIRQGWLCV